MGKSAGEEVRRLVERIAGVPGVDAIGISGGIAALPQAGEGDIDLFIYCDFIPEIAMRQSVMAELDGRLTDSRTGVFTGGNWGSGDFTRIDGIETWLMYFTKTEALREVQEVLDGRHPDRTGSGFYPIGRCAMLRNMTALHDRSGFLAELKASLQDYPESLAAKMITHHQSELEDTEDFERAVTRQDVFFYHATLDTALDHFLQVLFSLNRTFFPSRKRSREYIEAFHVKPNNCAERLLAVIRLGGRPEGVRESYDLWVELVEDLKELTLKAGF